MGIDDRGFDPAADGFGPHRDGHGDDKADAGREVLQENRPARRAQRDVPILGQHEIMPRFGKRRREIVELGTDRGAALRMNEAARRQPDARPRCGARRRAPADCSSAALIRIS